MTSEAVRQRIKFLVEHGGVYPEEKAATRPLMVGLAMTIIVLQIIELAAQMLLR
jgi:hypothetical protein